MTYSSRCLIPERARCGAFQRIVAVQSLGGGAAGLRQARSEPTKRVTNVSREGPVRTVIES